MSATLWVLLAWAGFAFIIAGCGALLLSTSNRVVTTTECFWVGVVAILCFGNLWHLLRPLDGWFWAAPCGAALTGWVRVRLQRSDWLVWLTVALFAVWVAGHALQPLVSPDAGLYHVQVVRWYAAAAAAPGLGNLNPYASFNHAFFILPAAFGVGPFADRGWHLANGLLLVAAMPLPVAALLRLPQAEPRASPVLVFTALLAARLIDAPLMMALSGPTADVAVLAAGTFLLARAAAAPAGPAWVSGLLLAGVLSLKVTSLGVVIAAALMEWRWPERWRLRETVLMSLLAACSLLPWVAHGVVLSGYLLYPVAWLRLPVDWAVPTEIARMLQEWAWAFARWPGHLPQEVEKAAWAGLWLQREVLNNRDFLLPAGVSLLCALGLGVLARLRRPSPNTLMLMAALLCGLTVWWLALPDLRFAGPLGWGLAGAMLGGVSEVLPTRRYVLGLLLLGLILGALVGSEQKLHWENGVPDLPPSRCTPTTLSTGESVCAVEGNRPCFERTCLRSDPAEVGTRRAGDLSAGFQAIAPRGP